MRILYIDIDSLRADHLGCYGYHRKTSPNIDKIAAAGIRFENCYVSDAPCLPSRSALFSGRFGIHNGVVGHGGTAADPFLEGKDRWFSSTLGSTSWMRCLRELGLKTATVSSFGERHSAWHWYANFSEIYNPGKHGEELADEVSTIAIDWITRNAHLENWFLHLNFWDPHTPYRVPLEYGDPFADEPCPEWYSEDVRLKHWEGCGSWSAQEGMGYGGAHPYVGPQYPRQPNTMHSMDEVRRMFDGYDTGILYADEQIGRVLKVLEDQNILDDTVVIISADHGENLGELNIHFDHQTADHCTARIPLIMRFPGKKFKKKVYSALIYQLDFAATLIGLLGGDVPENWDGRSFADAWLNGKDEGRDYLVLSQGAHTCQRSVRFEDFLCIRSYHDGYHCFPDVMLYNLKDDPYEQSDLAPNEHHTVDHAMRLLAEWHANAMQTATHPQDPMWTVLAEGGPLHTRVDLSDYLKRLRDTHRADCATQLEARHLR